MAAKKQPKSAALKYVYKRYIGAHPERIASLEEQRANLDIACKIYDLRIQAGLTQRELAKRIGTSAASICRLENADYEGHSLSMLRRIAAALGKRVEIRFLPARRKPLPA